jgi:hypothetical protein
MRPAQGDAEHGGLTDQGFTRYERPTSINGGKPRFQIVFADTEDLQRGTRLVLWQRVIR